MPAAGGGAAATAAAAGDQHHQQQQEQADTHPAAPAAAASTWAAARAVAAAAQSLARALADAANAAQAADVLQAALTLFRGDAPPPPPQPPQAAAGAGSSDAWQRECEALLQPHAASLGWPALRSLFYEQQFGAWACSVLTVAVGEWLPKAADDSERSRLARLAQDTFAACPARQALAALVGHLSAVAPHHGVLLPGAAVVTPLAADTAAQLLVQRFVSPGSQGVQQLMAAAAAACSSDEQQQLTAAQVQETVSLLASVPDHVQQLLPVLAELPQPSTVVAALVQQPLACLAQASSSGERHQAAYAAAARFAGLLLQKLVTRGHGSAVAAAVLQAAGSGPDTALQLRDLHAVLLLLSNQHAAATEKLLLRVLQLASSGAAQGGGGATHQQQQQEGALEALLCTLLAADVHWRHAAINKLLLRRTLPSATLQLLLRLLAGARPSLLPEAGACLAACWADSSTVAAMPVPQQAFMTAALVGCIQGMPRDFVDPAAAAAAAAGQQQAESGSGQSLAAVAAAVGITPSPYAGPQPQQAGTLVPSVLGGVSTRLASPSPAVRLQAMRVGRAYAAKLDPSKPLFDTAGPLSLMQDELWPGALGSAAPQQPDAQAQAQQQGESDASCVTAVASPAAVDDGGGTSSRVQALARLDEAAQASDSDDEDGFAGPRLAEAPPAAAAANGQRGTTSRSRQPGAARAAAASDTDSVAGSEASVDSLVAFDLREDLAAEAWWGPDGLGPTDGKVVSLRALAAALRKHDDWDAPLEALKRVEVLVRAEPDELPVVAPELARALLHCKVPVWAAPEPPPPGPLSPLQQELYSQDAAATADGSATALPRGLSSNAEVQRSRALSAVLALSPLTSGDTMVAELYSPHLDQYQRVLILDSLAAAATEMSDPRRAPQLAVAGRHEAPALMPPSAAQARTSSKAAALPAAGSPPQPAAGASGPAAPGMVAASSRVWGKVALAKQAAAAAAGGGSGSTRRVFRNRFAPVAVRWASALLQPCDVKQHGIDLFGRDSLLLGRLLTVLGTFVACAAETPAVVPLSAGLLELLKAQQVSHHAEVYVRRCALVAASQVVRHLPAARLAGAMVGRQQDQQDAVLVERLQWLTSWAQGVAAGDTDQHCRMLAAGCVAWHVELAEGAMAVLQHLPEPDGPDLSAAASQAAAGRRRGGKQIDVRLPTLDRLVLQ